MDQVPVDVQQGRSIFAHVDGVVLEDFVVQRARSFAGEGERVGGGSESRIKTERAQRWLTLFWVCFALRAEVVGHLARNGPGRDP